MVDRQLTLTCQVALERGERVIRPVAGCGSCSVGCAGARRGARIPLQWLDLQHAGWSPGERVHLSVRASGLSRAALLCFGLPTLSLLAGGLLAGAVAPLLALPAEPAGATGGLLAAFGALAGIGRFGRHQLQHLKPCVTRVEFDR